MCDERLAFVVELSAGGRGIQLEEWGSEWARPRARRMRPCSPPPGRLQYDSAVHVGLASARPVRGCAAELSVSPGETKLDFFFCAAPGDFRREVSFRSPTAAEDVRFLASIKTSAFS